MGTTRGPRLFCPLSGEIAEVSEREWIKEAKQSRRSQSSERVGRKLKGKGGEEDETCLQPAQRSEGAGT